MLFLSHSGLQCPLQLHAHEKLCKLGDNEMYRLLGQPVAAFLTCARRGLVSEIHQRYAKGTARTLLSQKIVISGGR